VVVIIPADPDPDEAFACARVMEPTLVRWARNEGVLLTDFEPRVVLL
jgi:hypothetical protein